jgi:hypothetical protein
MTLSYVIVFPVFLAALMVIVQGSLWYRAPMRPGCCMHSPVPGDALR